MTVFRAPVLGRPLPTEARGCRSRGEGIILGRTAPMAGKSTIHRIGTAGWQLPVALRAAHATGTQLEQYARVFNAVEINSTFYRPHRPATFQRWAASVPDDFRFSVKLHRGITHDPHARTAHASIAFLDMVANLGHRLGPVLVQFPPSRAFDASTEDLLEELRTLHAGAIVVEPRHRSWATPEAERLLVRLRMARVAADPPVITHRVHPGAHPHPFYFRLHGSPRVYWSSYDDERLRSFADTARKAPDEAWVIFDNTAAGAAAVDARRLMGLLGMERWAVSCRPASCRCRAGSR